MVEIDAEALVKEERQLDAVIAEVLLQSSVGSGLRTLCFMVFNLHLRPS
jgi:hypothetical protein